MPVLQGHAKRNDSDLLNSILESYVIHAVVAQ